MKLHVVFQIQGREGLTKEKDSHVLRLNAE